MDYKKLNEALTDLNEWALNKKFTLIAKTTSDNWGKELDQGEESQKSIVYDIGLGDSVYMKVVLSTDSYGHETGISSVQFVKPIEQVVTNFEAV